MNTKEIISSGILELYVAGVLSADENEQVVFWMKDSLEIREAVKSIELTIEQLAFEDAIEPNELVKSKLMSTINLNNADTNSKEKIQKPTLIIKPYWRWLAAASIILFFVSGIFNIVYYKNNNLLANKLSEVESNLAKINEVNKNLKSDISVVQNKYSYPIKLNGVNNTENVNAKIFWLKNTGEVFVDASNLPILKAGQQFQLWAIVDGKPLDAGLIITNSNMKYRIQKMKSFGKAEAFAITIEKEGGSISPTLNNMIVIGKIL